MRLRAFLLFSMLSLPALADDIRIEVSPSVRLSDYNPFSATPAIGTADITISNEGKESEAVDLLLVCEASPCRLRHGKDQLKVELDSKSQWLPKKGVTLATLAVRVPAQQTITTPVSFLVPSFQVEPQGLYQMRLNIIEGTDRKQEPRASFIVETTIGQHAEITLSAAAKGSFGESLSLLSLGEFKPNQATTAYLSIRSNAPVRLEMSSQNNSTLRHMDDASLPAIAYAMQVDGDAFTAGKPLTLDRRIPLTLNGVSVPLRVTPQMATPNLMAGLYRDVVTISVVPY